MRVIATAGHVDHGKSTLLRALTGMEPDRWEEERRRGLTIDLGFVWTGDLAFVDVPGHERFLTNMLAGVGPVPAVLFVVAADEGWRVQSQEHLDVVTALGISHGVLAITRSDLADPGAALAEARARTEGTALEGLPAVAVSARTGDGLPELRAALAALAAELPDPDPEADVRLWIDRVFTVAGRGTVVTGTLGAGSLATGDTLEAGGRPLRVRGLHSLGRAHDRIAGPARVAVNVRGAAADGLRRGDVLLTPGRWLPTTTLDVRLPPPREEARRLPRQALWHIGSAAVPANVRQLGDDTARIVLAHALPLRIGDRALVRDPGNRHLWGATVVDVRPPGLRRRGAATRRAAVLADMDGGADLTAELRRRGLARRADLNAMGVPATDPPEGVVVVGEWLVDPVAWAAWRERLIGLVAARAVQDPLDPGLPLEAARQALGLPDRALVDALADSAAPPQGLRRARGRLLPAGSALPPATERAIRTLEAAWAAEPFAAPDSVRLTELGLDARALAAAEAAGRLTRLAPGVVLPPDAARRAVAVLATLPRTFTTAQARQALGTSRRVAIPLLESLDAKGTTRRVRDGERELVRTGQNPGITTSPDQPRKE
ncbi:SelB C-terminal domain-containing protein [Nonomuraea sp. NPDC049152]|uniref:SelB domain-containing protein n=1 Tax=Nonomuraea sp. NPDC049152 TaxID=3154350 RepID=UPI003403A25F